ncbi:DUF2992 family protein [Acetobacterium paludosum]|uniref:DUF2992 family protein n=1 Tax=Acetobacterium paludosum TaxID=52693 RepID=A0A923KX96_9FIRM|nr:YjdF family protein [Acetobacterium paludosum]MBC3888081.1 DUF2992 family protein [Acetobacterium paludosum]
MDKIVGSLTVFFEEPFWVGVFEQIDQGELSVAKVVFGAEPKDYEIYDFLLKKYDTLTFSTSKIQVEAQKANVNPKRMQREISRQMEKKGIGTKAQQALKLEHEQNIIGRKKMNRLRTEEEKLRQFDLRQEKKKQKHKGR